MIRELRLAYCVALLCRVLEVSTSGYYTWFKRPDLTIRQGEEMRLELEIHAAHMDQKFEASAPNQIWLTDITYIPTLEGWLYLAGHKDVFTGEIVGYAMAERMTKYLVSTSLLRALATKRALHARVSGGSSEDGN